MGRCRRVAALRSVSRVAVAGVGPRDHLRDMGIEVVRDLPVGNNLQDHLFTHVPFATKTSEPYTGRALIPKLKILLQVLALNFVCGDAHVALALPLNLTTRVCVVSTL